MENQEKTRENRREYPSVRELVQDGWSVLVTQSFEDFHLVDSGVCWVSRIEAEEAILELRSLHDKEHFRFGGGRIRSQDCPWPVSNVEAILGTIGLHSCHVQMLSAKGGHVEADTPLVVVEFPKPHCHSDASKTATTRPKSEAAHWLSKFGVEPVGFLPPRSGEREGRRSDCESPEGLSREGASRKRRVAVSSPVPSTSEASHVCTKTSSFQRGSTSRQL